MYTATGFFSAWHSSPALVRSWTCVAPCCQSCRWFELLYATTPSASHLNMPCPCMHNPAQAHVHTFEPPRRKEAGQKSYLILWWLVLWLGCCVCLIMLVTVHV